MNWPCRSRWIPPSRFPARFPISPATVSLIARITEDDPRELLARCQASKTFCWVARKADAETADRIRALNLHGIHFQKESKRFYPKRELAAQVLGYVGMDDEGLSGIEREYNEQLARQARPHADLGGRPQEVVRQRRESSPSPGENVVLTIDQKIQYIAERELDAAMEETQAIAGTVIVENPHTGEILALANRPTFNPNVDSEIKTEAAEEPRRQRHLRARLDIQAGDNLRRRSKKSLPRPDEVFDCQMGSIVINGMRIRDSKPHGMLTVSDMLARIERRGSHQDRAAPRRRAFLQIHSRLRIRAADRHRACPARLAA